MRTDPRKGDDRICTEAVSNDWCRHDVPYEHVIIEHDPTTHPVDCPARPNRYDTCDVHEHYHSGPEKPYRDKVDKVVPL